MITIMLASRRRDNPNSNLKATLKSLYENAANTSNYEVLVKFDGDDFLMDFKPQSNFQSIVTPRCDGYAGLHKVYKDLFKIANPKSSLFWVLADDVIIETKDWDRRMLDEMDGYPDRYIVFNSHMADFSKISENETIEAPDCFPVWSRRWIEAQGFGRAFNTDAWTALVCHKLLTQHKVDRRLDISWLKINRQLCASDREGSERWSGPRRMALDILMDDGAQKEADRVALFIADEIALTQKMHRMLMDSVFLSSFPSQIFKNKYEPHEGIGALILK